MSDNVFGIEETPLEERLANIPGFAELNEEPEEETPPTEPEATTSPEAETTPDEGTPAEEAAPEAETEQAPEEEPAEATETQEDSTTPEAEEEETPEPRLWAGRYATPDDMEKGLEESRAQFRRATDARKAAEQAALEEQYARQQAEQAIIEALPILRQAAEREQQYHAFAEQFRQQTGEYPQGYSGPPAPQQGPAPQDVNQIIESRLAQEREAMAAQAEQQQYLARLKESVEGFYADHPEVEPRSQADNLITDTMQALNEAWADRGIELDETDRTTLDLVYEASKRPALEEVLRLKPEYFTSESGLQLARMEAAVLEGAPAPTTTQETRTVPASQVGKTSGQKKPFVESATGGSEEPAEALNEWDEIKQSVLRDRSRGGSVFQFE